MLRFTPRGVGRLGSASEFEVWTAGCEANVAAGCAALGLRATWVGRLPDNVLGRRVEGDLRRLGVDTGHIAWAPSDQRLGIFYYEPEVEPRPAAVIYDRQNTAAASMSPDDVGSELISAHRHLHVSGITPALSPSCRETVESAIARARLAGLSVSFDVNYRARLWTEKEAALALAPMLEQSTIVFCSEHDCRRLFDLHGQGSEQANELRTRFGAQTVVVTLGKSGAIGSDSSWTIHVPAVPVESTVGRLGSGDAFVAGFLSAHLNGTTMEASLRRGAAAASVKRTVAGDMLLSTKAEIDKLLGAEEGGWR